MAQLESGPYRSIAKFMSKKEGFWKRAAAKDRSWSRLATERKVGNGSEI
jgi:hypothetical protein